LVAVAEAVEHRGADLDAHDTGRGAAGQVGYSASAYSTVIAG
jgi:hypothetical protein